MPVLAPVKQNYDLVKYTIYNAKKAKYNTIASPTEHVLAGNLSSAIFFQLE